MVLQATICLFFMLIYFFYITEVHTDISDNVDCHAENEWIHCTAKSSIKNPYKIIIISQIEKGVWCEQINGDIYLLNITWNYSSCIYSEMSVTVEALLCMIRNALKTVF